MLSLSWKAKIILRYLLRNLQLWRILALHKNECIRMRLAVTGGSPTVGGEVTCVSVWPQGVRAAPTAVSAGPPAEGSPCPPDSVSSRCCCCCWVPQPRPPSCCRRSRRDSTTPAWSSSRAPTSTPNSTASWGKTEYPKQYRQLG